MKRNLTLIICFLMLASQLSSFAQNTHFTTQGVIEYDKTVNMYALIKKSIDKDNESFYGPAFESFKKSQPQFRVLKSTLTFDRTRTRFDPIAPENTSNGFFGNNPMVEQNNIIYTDVDAKTKVNQKTVFEETFLVKDTTRKINWKLTSETRDIIGYKCRRANALVMDSIYVVAFYTDEIPVSGGPEGFSGLPGMILGVALPHENITWFATKISEVAVPAKALMPPGKGKPVTEKGLADVLKGVMKDWGTWANQYYKAFLL